MKNISISTGALCLAALIAFSSLALPELVLASEGGAPSHGVGQTLLWIPIILLLAKLGGSIEKWGQPAVLGELLVGVALGNLILLGIDAAEPAKSDQLLSGLAQIGVVILLFQVGLESNLKTIMTVGIRALLVATVGVIVPFVLGTFVVGPWLLPGLPFNSYLFLGATLTATSVGITARVFQDLKVLNTKESQIVLGAAVIDDVMGLVILAVVSAVVKAGTVSTAEVAIITGKALGFLVAAIVVGSFTAPYFGKVLSKISSGHGMKLTLAISFAFIISFFAEQIGLAPIVGAFAAGLVLDPVHFRFFKDPTVVDDIREALPQLEPKDKETVEKALDHHSDRHVEDLIGPIAQLLVPIFFVTTGMAVNLAVLSDPSIVLVALGVTVAAIIGKLFSGLPAGKVNRWLVGVGMIPRGEVGLIFAMSGKHLGVVNDEIYAVIVIMIMITTLTPPPILAAIIRADRKKAAVN